MKSFITAAAFAFGLVTTADAATITVHEPDSSGRVFVDLEGEFFLDDVDIFSRVTKDLPLGKVYVSLNSPGGQALAYRMGDIIRQRHMKTVVPRNGTCASVCALIWLGGEYRFDNDHAQIGFHTAYDLVTHQRALMMNSMVADYVASLEYSQEAINWMQSAPPNDLEFLTMSSSAKHGIWFSRLDPPREATPVRSHCTYTDC
jgi:hypothetical protein